MFEFLGRSKPKAERGGTDPGPSTHPQTVQLGATQIEMVRMTLHGVLKMHGIPGTWIAGEVIPVHIPGRGEALLLQLEVMHWNDALVLHAPAFQQALLEGLKRFDPHADQTRYLFSWKFSPQSGCPHLHMPAPDFWVTSERVVLAPVATPVAAPVAAHKPSPPRQRFDLPRTAADGDDDDDHGFAATQVHDLH